MRKHHLLLLSFIIPVLSACSLMPVNGRDKSQKNNNYLLNPDPVFVGDQVLFGYYPQDVVSDEAIIDALNDLDAPYMNNWYFYNNAFYSRTVALPSSTCKAFDNGEEIIPGNTYWFKCNPISWDILEASGNNYYLVTTDLLDSRMFHSNMSSINNGGETIHPNNYFNSDIRNWLNHDFYEEAFFFTKDYVQYSYVANDASTCDNEANPYVCEDCNDYVFLPSHKDCCDPDYGYPDESVRSDTRKNHVTDWAKAKGAAGTLLDDGTFVGYYWTRSPSMNSPTLVSNVNCDGFIGYNTVTNGDCSPRPAINIKY